LYAGKLQNMLALSCGRHFRWWDISSWKFHWELLDSKRWIDSSKNYGHWLIFYVV